MSVAEIVQKVVGFFSGLMRRHVVDNNPPVIYGVSKWTDDPTTVEAENPAPIGAKWEHEKWGRKRKFDYDQITQLLGNGWSRKNVASIVGCADSTVDYVVKITKRRSA